MKYKTLGILGGMGPLSTVLFYEMLTKMQKADRDQDYLDIILYSKPAIPDRTAYITGISTENPLEAMTVAGLTLTAAGADVIAIPCVTAHYFYDELSHLVNVPLLHVVKEIADRLQRDGVKTVGLLATDGTLQSRLFHNLLEERGIIMLTPDVDHQSALMRLIYEVIKRGKSLDSGLFYSLADHLTARGAEAVVLGCTELSLVARDLCLPPLYVDALEVLAGAGLSCCGVEEILPIKRSFNAD